MNILLIVTGSISAYKAVDIANSFRKRNHEVKVVLTEDAEKMIPKIAFSGQRFEVYTETDEWDYPQGVLHIDLVKWADTVLVAPATLNTIAKYYSFITDNLALSILSAFRGTIYFAPAMNSNMWENSQSLFDNLQNRNVFVIPPVSKLLACGDTGVGGLADKADIINSVLEPLPPIRLHYMGVTEDSNSFENIDLTTQIQLPIKGHCGSFAYERRFHTHEGVDLYCPVGSTVYTADSGVIERVDWFTGVEANSPWWNSTKFVAMSNDMNSNLSLYGELVPFSHIVPSYRVKKGERIGLVPSVLKTDKGRPRTMLHFEQYLPHFKENIPFCWDNGKEKSSALVDPTEYLRVAYENWEHKWK